MISNIGSLIDGLDVSREISPDDFMFVGQNLDHYFSVGRSALRLICACLTATGEYAGSKVHVERILDFGCGYGRVCRYLRAAFPAAEISVGDVNAEAVNYCVSTFGGNDIGTWPPADSFDLIWVGSVFTHLSEPAARDLLYALVEALRPDGVLIFTTHGRFSYARHFSDPESPHYLPGRIANDRISAGFLATGYGFSGHAHQSERMMLIDPGVSITDARWVQRCLFASNGVMQIFFQERGWDFHQDVYGFTRQDLLRVG